MKFIYICIFGLDFLSRHNQHKAPSPNLHRAISTINKCTYSLIFPISQDGNFVFKVCCQKSSCYLCLSSSTSHSVYVPNGLVLYSKHICRCFFLCLLYDFHSKLKVTASSELENLILFCVLKMTDFSIVVVLVCTPTSSGAGYHSPTSSSMTMEVSNGDC